MSFISWIYEFHSSLIILIRVPFKITELYSECSLIKVSSQFCEGWVKRAIKKGQYTCALKFKTLALLSSKWFVRRTPRIEKKKMFKNVVPFNLVFHYEYDSASGWTYTRRRTFDAVL